MKNGKFLYLYAILCSCLHLDNTFASFQDYNDKNLRHDIALVKLEESLDFDAAINAVCLPERPLEVGEGMEIAGWGNTETGNGAWVTKKVRCLFRYSMLFQTVESITDTILLKNRQKETQVSNSS